MSAIFRHEGNAIDWTNTTGTDVAAGQIVALGTGRVGVANVDIPNTKSGALAVVGVFEITKTTTADTFAMGDLLDINGQTVDSAAGTSRHWAVKATTATETTMWVKING